MRDWSGPHNKQGDSGSTAARVGNAATSVLALSGHGSASELCPRCAQERTSKLIPGRASLRPSVKGCKGTTRQRRSATDAAGIVRSKAFTARVARNRFTVSPLSLKLRAAARAASACNRLSFVAERRPGLALEIDIKVIKIAQTALPGGRSLQTEGLSCTRANMDQC